ncbi:MAG: hypothetical protein ACXWFB_11030, partial [Nitrososphaeraceae archaeon]
MIKAKYSFFLNNNKRMVILIKPNMLNTKRPVNSEYFYITTSSNYNTPIVKRENKKNWFSTSNNFSKFKKKKGKEEEERDTRFDIFFKRANIKRKEFMYQLNLKLFESQNPGLVRARLLLDEYYKKFQLFNPFNIKPIQDSLQQKITAYYEKNRIYLEMDHVTEIPLKIFFSFFFNSVKEYFQELTKNIILFCKIIYINYKSTDSTIILNYLYLIYYYKKHIYLTNNFHKMIQFFFIMPLQM